MQILVVGRLLSEACNIRNWWEDWSLCLSMLLCLVARSCNGRYYSVDGMVMLLPSAYDGWILIVVVSPPLNKWCKSLQLGAEIEAHSSVFPGWICSSRLESDWFRANSNAFVLFCILDIHVKSLESNYGVSISIFCEGSASPRILSWHGLGRERKLRRRKKRSIFWFLPL
jgi:hypothetical protein